MDSENSSVGVIGENSEQLWEWMWTQSKAQEDFKNLPTNYGNAVIDEMKSHFITGASHIDGEIACLNPMFLDPENGTWSLSPTVSAFESFILEKHEPRKNDIMTPYLRAFSERVQEERRQLENTSFHLLHGNFFDICYRLYLKEFDVIDFTGPSNLTEHLGLANILNASSLIMSNNPHAILITESSLWRQHDNSQYQTIREFVEETLGTSMALIPSLFGFTLGNHLLLGNPLPTGSHRRTNMKLRWRKSPCYSHVKVRLLPIAEDFISRLQETCFCKSIEELDRKNVSTVLSYAFFVSSLTARISLDDAEQIKLYEPEIPPCYELAWKTVKAWMNGEDVVCVEVCFTLQQSETGSLKLLVSSEDLRFEQYFENFSMIRDGDTLQVSFLLLKDHSLHRDKTTIYLSRGAGNVQIAASCTLKEVDFHDFDVAFPFVKQENLPDCFLCDETEKSYCIYLRGISQESKKLITSIKLDV